MTDPFFVTDGFKELRARHRQQLARLPLDILRRAAFGTPERVALPDLTSLLRTWPATTVEAVIREWADEEAKAVAATFESAERDGGGDIRRFVVAALQYACEPHRRVFRDNDWSPDMLTGEEPQLTTEEGKSFQRVVTLMVLADVIADDGYQDPRIADDDLLKPRSA
ncbi:MAG: hypothetical protein Q8K63_00305 [Acidimicrobiales bacterium]|nr:hypothetical protein [Acidimicrobiales bacterium]